MSIKSRSSIVYYEQPGRANVDAWKTSRFPGSTREGAGGASGDMEVKGVWRGRGGQGVGRRFASAPRTQRRRDASLAPATCVDPVSPATRELPYTWTTLASLTSSSGASLWPSPRTSTSQRSPTYVVCARWKAAPGCIYSTRSRSRGRYCSSSGLAYQLWWVTSKFSFIQF